MAPRIARALGSEATVGMALVVVASTLYNVQVVMCQLMRAAGWSEMIMTAMSSAAFVPCFAGWFVVRRPPVPDLQSMKWVVMCGLAMALSLLTMIFAVRLGLPLGDFASLNSVNVIFAALLGRAFLGESLRWMHFVAIATSLVGALLISKPAVLFGQSSVASPHWLAYIYAIFSGFADAVIYVSSRRTADVLPVWSLLSFCVCTTLVCLASAYSDDSLSLAKYSSASSEGMAWLAALFVCQQVGMAIFLRAAQMCPAVLTAIVDTGTRMVTGYLSQVALFDAQLESLTIAGSVLMLAGVGIMAFIPGQKSASPTSAGPQEQSPSSDNPEVETPTSSNIDDETDSLASFIAGEYAGAEPREAILRLRFPRTGGGSSPAEPAAAVIGSAAASSDLAML
eukprot:CAMPEP_0203887946 /NCGR_PEP_ID=MMETSP0359-20131031/31596_1 /ASSEMBLY_ACC=CAM_ASM_000338 /TAXON_ID=268821 /ORGANISM="Scrippsiella Hangoei, Strain SHTV-5" /LENGTH=395 /DNA_ID=CAMNT_0050809055 /DNA_START=24 /DNA_END=1211 /DNA_ORIENTATION=-